MSAQMSLHKARLQSKRKICDLDAAFDDLATSGLVSFEETSSHSLRWLATQQCTQKCKGGIMATQSALTLGTIVLFLLTPMNLMAQPQQDPALLRNWPAPMYWQPSQSEEQTSRARTDRVAIVSLTDVGAQAQTPANSLVFVAMTPCRVVDTRTGSGFSGAFGPPSLVGGASRTFPIQASSTCSIPSIAQAYSFNITVVPFGFLDYLTVWPTGQAQPNASTLNGYVQTVIANAAIVPAGISGRVDVFASHNTDLIIDINGYYAPQSGITLAQASAAAPSLSFSGDSGTGIYSSAAGTLNIATSGTNRLTIRPDGDLELLGSIRKGGILFLHNLGTRNMGVGLSTLASNETNPLCQDCGDDDTAIGHQALDVNTTGSQNTAIGSHALGSNTTGSQNTAIGHNALSLNTFGHSNTAVGTFAGINLQSGSNNTFIGRNARAMSPFILDNATAIGANAIVNANNKIRLGDSDVTVLESPVGLTVVSDKNAKENFRLVNAEDVLMKLSGLPVPSWNYIGHDPKDFRHYGPMAQDFFMAFGNDELGKIGSSTTINSSDLSGILMLAVQALEKRSSDLYKNNESLRSENQTLQTQMKMQQEQFQEQQERIRRLEATLNPSR
jgi:hypothetical protein